METTILLVDDHPIVRQGLCLLLEGKGDMRIVGEAGDGGAALEQVRELKPDVVIMDITMPKLSGIDATRQILVESPDTKIIALSIHGEKHFVEGMLQAGAAGYLLKESIPEELVNAIRAVIQGEVVLSAKVAGIVGSEYRKALPDAQALGEQASEAHQVRGLASSIIRTKLHQPPVTPDLVPRPHLLARLDKGLLRPLTLVCAPAGFGKTTLLASWLECRGGDSADQVAGRGVGRSGVTPPLQSAWLQLDAEDSDLVVFVSYFLAAIQTLFPHVGAKTQALLEAPARPPMSVLAQHLIVELCQVDEPFVLVLDDYHTIEDEEVHEFLAALVRHLPPHAHLAIATRTDAPFPLTNLRARGQVLEIRTSDLRLWPEEVQIFLEGMLGRRLGREVTDLLADKTEGWVVGLRLAALSMRGLADVESFAQRFRGTSSAYVADYLLGEVLAQQPTEVQAFLLSTSILNRFCAPLCDAVVFGFSDPPVDRGPKTNDERRVSDQEKHPSFVHRPSSRSAASLDELKRASLFLVSLDAEGRWYRYHHLFRDLLRHRLEQEYAPGEIATLHARASAWYAANGLTEEAIRYALAAGDTVAAAQIVERNRLAALDADQWHMLSRWLDRLPHEIVQERPDLLLARAWILQLTTRVAEIPPLVERAESLLGDDASVPGLLAEISYFRGLICYFRGEGARSVEFLTKAISLLPPTVSGAIRAQAEYYIGVARYLSGQKGPAIRRLNEGLRTSDPREGLVPTRLIFGLCWIHMLAGEWIQASREGQQLEHVARRSGLAFVETWALYVQGSASFQIFDLEAARQHLSLVVENRYITNHRAGLDAMAGLALTQQLMDQPDKASQTMELALEFAQWTKDPDNLAIVRSCQARLALLRGDLNLAAQWQRSFSEAPANPIMLFFLENPCITDCRVLVARGTETSLKAATEKLEQIRQAASATHNICQVVEIVIWLALASFRQERLDEALETLERALDLAEPGGWIRPFVEPGAPMATLLQELVARRAADGSLSPATAAYLNQVFAALSNQTVAGSPAQLTAGPPSFPLVEPLTEREMEVLALLARRMSNQEIARELVIATGTVKGHAHNIYGKLGVGDRQRAVARARELGLLPPP